MWMCPAGTNVSAGAYTSACVFAVSKGKNAPYADHYRPDDMRASITTDGLSILPLIEVPGSTLNDHAVGRAVAPPMSDPPITRQDGTIRPA